MLPMLLVVLLVIALRRCCTGSTPQPGGPAAPAAGPPSPVPVHRAPPGPAQPLPAAAPTPAPTAPVMAPPAPTPGLAAYAGTPAPAPACRVGSYYVATISGRPHVVKIEGTGRLPEQVTVSMFVVNVKHGTFKKNGTSSVNLHTSQLTTEFTMGVAGRAPSKIYEMFAQRPATSASATPARPRGMAQVEMMTGARFRHTSVLQTLVQEYHLADTPDLRGTITSYSGDLRRILLELFPDS